LKHERSWDGQIGGKLQKAAFVSTPTEAKIARVLISTEN